LWTFGSAMVCRFKGERLKAVGIDMKDLLRGVVKAHEAKVKDR